MAGGLAMPYIVRPGFAATPVRTLKLVFADTVAHPAFKSMQRFADNVKKKTDGAIAVDCYGAGQLGSESNQVTGLQTGIYDFAGQTSGFVEKVYIRFNVLDLPFLFSTTEKAEKMLDGPVGTKLLNELPAKGIYGLSYGWWGWRELDAVNRAATEPKDIQGLKIRVQPGAIFASTFTTLKAIPIGIDITEVYLALSDGTIGAIEVPIISVLANKLQEVLKVVTSINHDYNTGIMMVSKRTFDSLDKKYQADIRQAAQELTADWRKTVGDASLEAEKTIVAAGVKLIKSDQVDRAAYRKAVEPVYEQYRRIVGPDLMDAVMKAAA
jgi:tripartite ATP-independent transporter DctP family solute receptor